MNAKIKSTASTSGDTLAKAAGKVGFSTDELRSIRNWLANQLVAQEYAKLGQGGHTNTQVPLRQVFVDLPVAPSAGGSMQGEDRKLFLSCLLDAVPLDLRNAFKTRPDVGVVSCSDKDKEDDDTDLFVGGVGFCHPKSLGATLLIGGPGQGKSTLGQLACQINRAALIHPAVNELTSVQRDLVNSFIPAENILKSKNDSSSRFALPNTPLLPLQITLPDFAAWAASSASAKNQDRVPIFLKFLADLPSAREVELDASKIFELICFLPALIVMDGFDEVGATQDRMRIIGAARELLLALAEKNASAQILATTRPQGYADELSQVGVRFHKVFLSPLMRSEALEYAKKLIEAKILGADQQAKALGQIHAAAAEPATERLLTTPLQVTILTALVQQLGRAPRERWNLFSRYFAYTFDREIERGTYASALLAEHRAHIERIHARVALLLQVEAERDGGAAARMTKERLEEVIAEVLAEDEVAKDQRKDLIRDIASAAETRLVFLVEPEPGKFGFEIRSLQEFMAAWALTSGRDTEVEARLHQVSKAPMFRNVALFISSRLFSEGSPLRDTLADRICGSLDTDDADELSRVSLVGSLLALETLEEGAALSQPKRARALMGRAVGLLALPPGLEHVRLARVANEDTFHVLLQAIDRCFGSKSRSSDFCAASAWICIIDATNRGELWADEIGRRYWSTESASRTLFDGLARARVPLGEWVSKRLESIADSVTPDLFLDAHPQHVERNVASTWASWLASVYGSNANWRPRSRIAGLVFISSTRNPRSYISKPEYSAPNTDLWRAWIAAANFDILPNIENLAGALEEMAKVLNVACWKKLKWRASWPLTACINSASRPEDFLKLAKLVRGKKLGDTKEWDAAERQWKDGFDIAGILSAIDESVPWTLDALAVNPPFMAVHSWHFINRYGPRLKRIPIGDLLRLANSIYLRSKSLAIRQRLAEICLGNWRGFSTRANRSGLDPFAWIKTAPNSASLLVPRPKTMSVLDWRALLDACDTGGGYPWLYNVETIFNSLVELTDHPVILSLAVRAVGPYADHLSQDGEVQIDAARKVVTSINANSTTNISTRGDIAVLKFFAGYHPPVQDAILLQEIMEASRDNEDLWMSLFGALKISGLSKNRISSLFCNIYGLLGPNHPVSHLAIKGVRDALQKRTSDLDSRTTWDKLALPLPYPSQPLQAKLEGGIPASPVRISRLEIHDVGGIERVALELLPPTEGAGQWTIVIGPNGAGKTTILRSLALALRSVKHPSIWPKGAFSGSWQRIPSPGQDSVLSSHILVKLGDGVEHRTLIRPNTSISITQLPEQDKPRLFPIFAYGCRRGSALGGPARQVNLNDDDGPEIATLFDEGADLIQAETWLISLEGDVAKSAKSKIIYNSVVEALKKLMNFASVEVIGQKVIVSEDGRTKIPFSYLSDGYLTNAGWFLDLVARWIALADRDGLEITEDFLSKMRGLVLIDEIDLHLHPRWQIEIISRTRALLPQMSFFATTHNPLTLVGAKAGEVWMLDKKLDSINVRHGIETPMLLTGGQIYKKYFGVSDIYPDQYGRMLQRFGYLSGYAKRNDAEQAEMVEVQVKLSEAGIDPGWDIVPRAVDGG